MSQEKFFISKNGEQMGPYHLDEIRSQLNAGQVQPTDYIYDETQSDWVFILDLSQFEGRETKSDQGLSGGVSSLAAEKQAQESEIIALECEAPDVEWYVLKGDDKFGPFSFMDIVNMLQEKSVFEFDFVWNHYLPSWKRLAELESFSPDRLGRLSGGSQSQQVRETLFRRKHRRLNYGKTILVHNNKQVWKGQSVDVSASGARVMLDDAALVVGETIYLHVKSGDDVPPFNAVCEIVNKKAETGEAESQSFFFYGLKFKSIGLSSEFGESEEISSNKKAVS